MSNPSYFHDLVSSRGESIEIIDRQEICQGGPQVGCLMLDGVLIFPNIKFGGPMLESEGHLYVPMRKKKLFFNGFVLAGIDLDSGELSELGVKSEVIYLISIEKNMLYYSTTYSCEKEGHFDLDKKGPEGAG